MIKHIPDGFEGFNPDRVLELMQEAVDYVNDLPYVDLYDIEIEMTVNAGQVALEWMYNRLNQPSEYSHVSCAQYFANCMTRNGGTLEYRKWSEEF